MRFLLTMLLAVGLIISGCVGTVTRTTGEKVTTVTMAWGNAGVSTGGECEEEDGKCLQVKGGPASEGFLNAVLSPIGTVLKGLLAGL